MTTANDSRPTVLLATTNAGKVREFNELLHAAPCRFVGLKDVGITDDVEETGATFEDNSAIKAIAYAKMSGMWSLAEDSGIEVNALSGAPGPLSKRYAGPDATDLERLWFLLNKIKDVPWDKRGARFRSVITVASPQGKHWTVQGRMDGFITYEPKGTGGFGYDPVFWLPERGKTTAELTLAEKNEVSHRSKAAVEAVKLLQRLSREGVLR